MTTRTKPFKPGQRVSAWFRVPPFLSEETLVVVSCRREGRGASAEWRVFVQSETRRHVQGWLSAETLETL